MRYLHEDKRTLEHLHVWASGAELVTAAYFFWNSGKSLQKSQLGLLRTILYQVLSNRPKLIPYILSQRWEVYTLFGEDRQSWNLLELQQAFRRLVDEDISETNFYFFVDGLDEFEEDIQERFDYFTAICSSSSCSYYCSSSPEKPN